MRVTTAFKRLLRLDGVNVTSVAFGVNVITVVVALRRRRLICPHCGHKTRYRYDTRPCGTWISGCGECRSKRPCGVFAAQPTGWSSKRSRSPVPARTSPATSTT